MVSLKLRTSNLAFYFLVIFLLMVFFTTLILLPTIVLNSNSDHVMNKATVLDWEGAIERNIGELRIENLNKNRDASSSPIRSESQDESMISSDILTNYDSIPKSSKEKLENHNVNSVEGQSSSSQSDHTPLTQTGQTANDSQEGQLPQSKEANTDSVTPLWLSLQSNKKEHHFLYYGDDILINKLVDSHNEEMALNVNADGNVHVDTLKTASPQNENHQNNSQENPSTAVNSDEKSKEVIDISTTFVNSKPSLRMKCRNTRHGKLWVTDSRGYVCGIFDIDPSTGCCPSVFKGEASKIENLEGKANIESKKPFILTSDSNESSGTNTPAIIAKSSQVHSKRYSCESCKENRCCKIYEYCVSCCMKDIHDARKNYARILETAKNRSNIQTIYNRVQTLFEYCQLRCRTYSESVVHENRYRTTHVHCF